MDIEALGLKAGETVRDLEELCPHGLQVAEALFESEVSEMRLFAHTSLRRNVENFSYCLIKAFFQYARKM